MSAATAPASGPRSVLVTVLIFAVVTPGLGFLVFLGVLAAIFGFADTWLFRWSEVFWWIVVFAFGLGGIPASALGVAVARRDRRSGTGAAFAAAGGLVAGIVFSVALSAIAWEPSRFFLYLLIGATAFAVLGALLAWWLTRRRAAAPEPAP